MKSNKIIKGIALITQLGISMMAPIALTGVIGYYLNEKFNTEFWFILLILLGIMAGFRNVYILIKKFYDFQSEKENLEKNETERSQMDDRKKR